MEINNWLDSEEGNSELYEENDNTSQNITNPPSEINNAYGIFGGINADTVYVNVMPQ